VRRGGEKSARAPDLSVSSGAAPAPATIRRVHRRLLLTHRPALALALLLPALAGCGLASSHASRAVTLTITSDFGAHRVAEVKNARPPDSQTLLTFVRRRFAVQTRGDSVVAIDGASATPASRWFLFVNGSAVGLGSSQRPTVVHPGDRIWWDLHDDGATGNVPAVVGSFPAPFVSGFGGKRLPVTVECAPDVSAACARVGTALAAVGVPAASQLLGTGSGTSTLGIVVGTWRELSGEIAALLIAHGPSTGGVYGHFAGGKDRTLDLLDPRGSVVRRLGAGAGLVAATGNSKTAPTWFVTGTDAAGVGAAASILTARRLKDHFAVAVQGTRDLPVPAPSGR
jgi:hypothetical protein